MSTIYIDIRMLLHENYIQLHLAEANIYTCMCVFFLHVSLSDLIIDLKALHFYKGTIWHLLKIFF